MLLKNGNLFVERYKFIVEQGRVVQVGHGLRHFSHVLHAALQHVGELNHALVVRKQADVVLLQAERVRLLLLSCCGVSHAKSVTRPNHQAVHVTTLLLAFIGLVGTGIAVAVSLFLALLRSERLRF